MKTSFLSLLTAIIVLNVAPGYDACGNKIRTFVDEPVDSFEVDSFEIVIDSLDIECDSLVLEADSM